MRLAAVVSHPIQYYAPLYRNLAARPGIELKVFFTWHGGTDEVADHGFGRAFKWDIPLTEGYAHEVVPNTSRDPGTHHFMGLQNPGLVERLLDWKPDAVHLTGYAWHSHLIALRALHRRGLPVLFRGDSHLLDEPALGFHARLKRVVLGRVYRWPRAFLCVGRANRNYYAELGVDPERLYSCPHSIDVDRFSADAQLREDQARRWRETLGIDARRKVLLYAGKFEDRKRSVALMRAFREAAPPDCLLLMVGDGAHGDEVRRIAAGDPARFRVLPFQNQSLMPVVYRLGDLFVLPSAYGETWGLGVNEAMACARPVLVSSRVGCAPDLVHADCGEVFPADDWAAFARILSCLVQDASRLRAMGAAALARIAPIGIEATAAATLACAQEVLRGEVRRRPRFVVSGFFGRPNFGDELLSRCLTDELAARHPGSRVSLLTHNRATSATYCDPDAVLVEGVFPSPRFFASWFAQVRALRRADLLAIGGGGLVNDHYSWEAIPRFVVPACLAVLFSKPIVFVGLGAVEVRRGWLAGLARFAIGRAQALYCRDPASLEEVAKWAAPGTPAVSAPDLAALAMPAIATPAVGEAALCDAGHALANFREDPPAPFNQVVALCAHLLEHHPRLVLLASEIHDLPFYRRLVAALGDEARARTSIVMPRSVSHAVALIRSAERVIAERLHVNLVAAFAGRPLFAIEYERKVRAQMERLLDPSARCAVEDLADRTAGSIVAAARPADRERLAPIRREAQEALAQAIAHGLSQGKVSRPARARLLALAHLCWLLPLGALQAARTVARRAARALKA